MCVAGFPGADCQCRDCRSTCPLLKRSCSIRNKCDECKQDDKQMNKILGLDMMTKIEKAKQKVIDSIREYRLLLENDKNDKIEELIKELKVV